MKRPAATWTAIFLVSVLALAAPGLRVAAQDGPKGQGKGSEKQAADLDMSNLSLETIRKEGKATELSPGGVQISPERQQLIGVRFGTAEMKPLLKVIRTSGRVDYDERRLMTIAPKVGGWVEELYVDFTGAHVKRGDPLLTLYSPELVSTQEEYLVALRAREDLVKSPFPEVAASGRSLAESARRRLKLWDISDEQILELEQSGRVRKTLTLYSPYEGFVLERMVYRGMNFAPGTALFKLADLSVVWVYADIYENEISLIRLGQSAAVKLPFLPGGMLTGKAIYIYPALDPKARTAKVRFEFPNPGGALKPEMFANVEIRVDLGRRLVVPEGAVIDSGLRQVAIVDKGQGYFEPREVKLGVRADDEVEVIQGLKAGERVVTSANFLIDSESRLREAVKDMAGGQHGTHGH